MCHFPEWVDPPAQIELPHETADLWRIQLNTPTDADALRELLSAEELERAGRFRFPKDRDRYTIARSGLRSILARYLHVTPAEIRFQYGAHGKPRVSPKVGLQFNLSHAEKIAVVGLAMNRSVGVDVERIQCLSDLEKLALRCFSESEASVLFALPEDERPERFFRIWTRKEACLKALGSGFSVSPVSATVMDDLGEALPVARVGDSAAAKSWRMFEFIPASGYRAALALEEPASPRTLRFWEMR